MQFAPIPHLPQGHCPPKMRVFSSWIYLLLGQPREDFPVKYVLVGALLFAPLAVAGSYLGRDPTSTETPVIRLPATTEQSERPAKPAKTQARQRRARRAIVRDTRPKRTVPPAPATSGSGGDDDDEPTRPRTRAAPVPVPDPAAAGRPRATNSDPDEANDEDAGGDDGDD